MEHSLRSPAPDLMDNIRKHSPWTAGRDRKKYRVVSSPVTQDVTEEQEDKEDLATKEEVDNLLDDVGKMSFGSEVSALYTSEKSLSKKDLPRRNLYLTGHNSEENSVGSPIQRELSGARTEMISSPDQRRGLAERAPASAPRRALDAAAEAGAEGVAVAPAAAGAAADPEENFSLSLSRRQEESTPEKVGSRTTAAAADVETPVARGGAAPQRSLPDTPVTPCNLLDVTPSHPNSFKTPHTPVLTAAGVPDSTSVAAAGGGSPVTPGEFDRRGAMTQQRHHSADSAGGGGIIRGGGGGSRVSALRTVTDDLCGLSPGLLRHAGFCTTGPSGAGDWLNEPGRGPGSRAGRSSRKTRLLEGRPPSRDLGTAIGIGGSRSYNSLMHSSDEAPPPLTTASQDVGVGIATPSYRLPRSNGDEDASSSRWAAASGERGATGILGTAEDRNDDTDGDNIRSPCFYRGGESEGLNMDEAIGMESDEQYGAQRVRQSDDPERYGAYADEDEFGEDAEKEPSFFSRYAGGRGGSFDDSGEDEEGDGLLTLHALDQLQGREDFNAALKKAAAGGCRGVAEQVWHAMQMRDVEPDMTTLHLLLKCLTRSLAHPSEAEALAAEVCGAGGLTLDGAAERLVQEISFRYEQVASVLD